MLIDELKQNFEIYEKTYDPYLVDKIEKIKTETIAKLKFMTKMGRTDIELLFTTDESYYVMEALYDWLIKQDFIVDKTYSATGSFKFIISGWV